MPLCPMRQMLDEARKGGYGVGAYNVNNMEQIQAIIAAAGETKSPVIIQASRGALEYTNLIYLKHLMAAAVEEHPELPIVLHLDHGPNLKMCQEAIALGFTSVMIDGSIDYDKKTPEGKHPARSFEDNLRATKDVVDYAHARGVSVEIIPIPMKGGAPAMAGAEAAGMRGVAIVIPPAVSVVAAVSSLPVPWVSESPDPVVADPAAVVVASSTAAGGAFVMVIIIGGGGGGIIIGGGGGGGIIIGGIIIIPAFCWFAPAFGGIIPTVFGLFGPAPGGNRPIRSFALATG